jgi:hypothetical protein
MANVKVKVLSAVVDGKTTGSILEINEKSAKYLASIKYVEILKSSGDGEKGSSAPKKPSSRRRKTNEK